jgi:hypothetical protein
MRVEIRVYSGLIKNGFFHATAKAAMRSAEKYHHAKFIVFF